MVTGTLSENINGVAHDELCEIFRRRSHVRLAFKTLTHELWKTAHMIKMCVRYYDSIYGWHIKRKWRIHFLFCEVTSLLKTAINENLSTRTLHHEIRTGDYFSTA